MPATARNTANRRGAPGQATGRIEPRIKDTGVTSGALRAGAAPLATGWEDPDHEIRVDRAFVLKGDAENVAVIFNNLSGVNFEGKDPGAHPQYLARMAAHFFGHAEAIRPGQRLELAQVGGRVVVDTTVGATSAPRVRPAELAPVEQPRCGDCDPNASGTQAEAAPEPRWLAPQG